MFVPHLKILGAVVPEKSLTKNVTGEKEKRKNKGNDKHDDTDSFLHDTSSCNNVCTKFQNPRCIISLKIFDIE